MLTSQRKSHHQVMAAASGMNGEGGIRTPGIISDTQHFQCCTIGRSVTSPNPYFQGGFVVVSLSLRCSLTPALTPGRLISTKETPSRVNGRVSVTPPSYKPEVMPWRSLSDRMNLANRSP